MKAFRCSLFSCLLNKVYIKQRVQWTMCTTLVNLTKRQALQTTLWNSPTQKRASHEEAGSQGNNVRPDTLYTRIMWPLLTWCASERSQGTWAFDLKWLCGSLSSFFCVSELAGSQRRQWLTPKPHSKRRPTSPGNDVKFDQRQSPCLLLTLI